MVGRVNVGKSTLFNRLVGRREALVSEVAGATRDIRWGEVVDNRKSKRREKRKVLKESADKQESAYNAVTKEILFRLADTAGLNTGDGMVHRLSQKVLQVADYVWLVIDAHEADKGLTADEQKLACKLRRSGNNFCVVLNKSERNSHLAEGEQTEAEAEGLRLGNDLFCVSATHGIGLDNLIRHTQAFLEVNRSQRNYDDTVRMTRKADSAPTDEPVDKPAIENSISTASNPDGDLQLMMLGRPNVGKSSLVNMLLGEERMVVSEVAGETHEAISLKLPREVVTKALGAGCPQWQVADSVGIRRQARIGGDLERLGVAHSLRMLRRADVLVLVLDASQSPSRQDARLASMVLRSGCGLVIAMNKWDLLTADQRRSAERNIAEKLFFAGFAPRVATSTILGSGGGRLLRVVRRVQREHGRKLRSVDLNRALESMVVNRPPPAVAGHTTRLLYATQTDINPPCFRLFTNHPEQIPASYSRYIEGQIRHHFGFLGTPLRLIWQGK